MSEKFYQNKLYPLQDKVLRIVEKLDVDFYLTGGTSLSRCYLQHRYSDDLDFFLNMHPGFKQQTEKVVSKLRKIFKEVDIVSTADTFLRLIIEKKDVSLKVDFVNDIEFHYGEFIHHRIFHRIDNWRNILSNKLCSLSRMEPKDIFDIFYIARQYKFSWEDIINEAKMKDLWVDPIDICQIIKQFPLSLSDQIKWIRPDRNLINEETIISVHDDIFWSRENSIFQKEP